uniref:Methyltransferase type 11 domain-containing protein n=1 Tax=Chromera velia CCMP2878 TaxID=1169474 RepID=A0A0G4H5J4_9ALVE|eukprot:Cvel_24773.t1-p1 / transcript=Cvel_24773.t1 / gene=Cvel_24773 / organism=Chromera_velia_CCMP2878 / gene_product=hypothetical protein / transcript_product=hypothetical protein / location=Cvel_scaffold2723:15095-16445(+) / protein_length=421 / sequence_SO=supercontig / SO=protein_coding / is_pseudo=false
MTFRFSEHPASLEMRLLVIFFFSHAVWQRGDAFLCPLARLPSPATTWRRELAFSFPPEVLSSSRGEFEGSVPDERGDEGGSAKRRAEWGEEGDERKRRQEEQRSKMKEKLEGWRQDGLFIRDDPQIEKVNSLRTRFQLGQKVSAFFIFALLFGVKERASESKLSDHRGQLLAWLWEDYVKDFVLQLKEQSKTSSAPVRLRLLDLGYGKGVYFQKLQAFGELQEKISRLARTQGLPDVILEVTGFDTEAFPEAAIVNSRGMANQKKFRLECVSGDAQNLPFESEAFDIVLSSALLCRVQTPAKVLKEAARVLKKGGMFASAEHVEDEDGLFKALQGSFTVVNRQLQKLPQSLDFAFRDTRQSPPCDLLRKTDGLLRRSVIGGGGGGASGGLFSRPRRAVLYDRQSDLATWPSFPYFLSVLEK